MKDLKIIFWILKIYLRFTRFFRIYGFFFNCTDKVIKNNLLLKEEKICYKMVYLTLRLHYTREYSPRIIALIWI